MAVNRRRPSTATHFPADSPDSWTAPTPLAPCAARQRARLRQVRFEGQWPCKLARMKTCQPGSVKGHLFPGNSTRLAPLGMAGTSGRYSRSGILLARLRLQSPDSWPRQRNQVPSNPDH